VNQKTLLFITVSESMAKLDSVVKSLEHVNGLTTQTHMSLADIMSNQKSLQQKVDGFLPVNKPTRISTNGELVWIITSYSTKKDLAKSGNNVSIVKSDNLTCRSIARAFR